MDIELIGKPYTHHAVHSGYHQLAARMNRESVWKVPSETGLRIGDIRRYLNGWYGIEQALQERGLAETSWGRSLDLVHFIYGESDFRVFGVQRQHRPRVIASYHQPEAVLRHTGIDEEVIRSLDAIVIMSESQRPFFERMHGNAIYRVLHGIDLEFFSPGELGQSEDFRILTVGQWLRDFDLYFRVAVKAATMGLPLQFRLVSRPLPIPKALIPSNCTLLTGLSDVELRDEYRKAALLFLPLLEATANNSLLEAIACGVPYVVSDVGGVREYVDETGGLLLKEEDEATWLEALMSLGQTGRKREAHSHAARALALRHDWTVAANAMDALYNSIA